MGLRFRKSFKIAPGVKVNFGKKSSSVTLGGKGVHYTVNSKGKKTASVGIPGTGISYVSSSGGSSGNKKSHSAKAASGGAASSYSYGGGYSNSPKDQKKWYQKTGWIIFWLILFFPAGLVLMWKYANWKKPIKGIISAVIVLSLFVGSSTPELTELSLSADTSQAYDINDKVKIALDTTPDDYSISKSALKISGGTIEMSGDDIIFTSDKAGKYTVFIEYSDVKSNVLTIEFEDKAAEQKRLEEEAAKKAEEERIAAEQKAEEERLAAEQAAQAEQEEQEEQSTQEEVAREDPVVYITNTGSKYHRAGCRHLKTQIKTTLSAVAGAYEPCGTCSPPTQ